MRGSDYAILVAVLAVAVGVCAATFLRPAEAEAPRAAEFADAPREAAYEPPAEPPAETAPGADEVPPAAESAESAGEYADEATSAPYAAPETFGGVYVAEYDEAYNEHGPTRDMPGWHDGYLETWYNASSHYLAPTWTVDDEGFYRDQDGRYVVGVEVGHADEMPYGTVVMTGRGEAAVYDYGSGAEVHDFATVW